MKRTAFDATLDDAECTRVFVGSLSFATTWQALKDHFKAIGDVEYASVLKTPQGQSKGCGMVDYKTHADAVQAARRLNGSLLDGAAINVKLDVEGKRRQREMQLLGVTSTPSIAQEPFYSITPQQVKRVFVGNLSYQTTWQSLKDHFQQYVEVELASVLLKPDRTSKGCGMVDLKTHDDAERAVELFNNSELDNRRISVKLDVDGKYRSRPAPGTRAPVHQVATTSSPGPGRLGDRPSGGGGQFAGGGKGGRQFLPINGPVQGSAQALSSLIQIAALPDAKGLDWPALIKRVSQQSGIYPY